jgi:hypothetical protein
MNKYIPFTDEQKLQANAVDLPEFLARQGVKLLKSGTEWRISRDHSVTIRGRDWFDHASEKGGHAISFVQEFYKLSYPDAVTMLLGGEGGKPFPQAAENSKSPPKSFVLPTANETINRVFAYLTKTRKIQRSTVAFFAERKLLYEDTPHHNAVFVGYDSEGVPRYAQRHGTQEGKPSFQQNIEGIDLRFSFHWIGNSECLYAFESPIDLMSFIDLNTSYWIAHSCVSCCGVSSKPILEMLKLAPQIKTVNLCLDNDETGCQACARMSELVKERGAAALRLTPKLKDWNEDLIKLRSN